MCCRVATYLQFEPEEAVSTSHADASDTVYVREEPYAEASSSYFHGVSGMPFSGVHFSGLYFSWNCLPFYALPRYALSFGFIQFKALELRWT